MAKYLIHTYQHASGHKQKTRQRVYREIDVDNAMKNWRVLGGSIEWADTLPGVGEYEELRLDVIMTEISEMIDGNSYPALTTCEPGSPLWDGDKVKFMNAIRDIYYGMYFDSTNS